MSVLQVPEAMPSKAPLISVVTVVRNAASIVQRTLDSVLLQSYPRLEFIVVDGASTDGTIDVIRRYESRIAAFRSSPDNGISDAFNKGANIATGDAILYMNAGDEFIDTHSLSDFVSQIPEGTDVKECVVYGDALIAFATTTKVQVTDHRTLQSGKQTTICHQSVLVGSQVQKRFPYDERLKLKMDLDLWLRCQRANVPFIKVPIPVCRYLAGGVTGNPQNVVASVVEAGMVRVLNGASGRTVRTAGILFLSCIKATSKKKLREILGSQLYMVAKKAIGRSTIENS